MFATWNWVTNKRETEKQTKQADVYEEGKGKAEEG